MSSEKQKAIQVFKRLYNENSQIKEILNTTSSWPTKINQVLNSGLLNSFSKLSINKWLGHARGGGLSADVWKAILASATTPTPPVPATTSTTTDGQATTMSSQYFQHPATTSDDGGAVETKQAKGARTQQIPTKNWGAASSAPGQTKRSKNKSRRASGPAPGKTKSWGAASSASGETKSRRTAKKKSRRAAESVPKKTKSGTPSPLPFNSDKMGQFGEHFLKPKVKKKKEKKPKYTSVELATTFCPGINLTDRAKTLFGHEDFLQILQQYNALKDKIFRGEEQFTEMLNCDNDNISVLMSKLNEKPV